MTSPPLPPPKFEDHPWWRGALSSLTPFIGIFLVGAIFAVLAPGKLNWDTWRIILVQTVPVGLAACGMTYVIISGGIDLSVGSMIALASVTSALVLRAGYGIPAALGAALLTGTLCGLYNGVLINLLRLPPFIATLGTMGFYRGLSKWFSESSTVRPEEIHGIDRWLHPWPEVMGHPSFLGLSPGIWILLGVTVAMAAALRFSLLGRYTLAIGSNEATARLCGIRIGRTKLVIYSLAGLLAGLAGLMTFARLTEGDPTSALGLELDVIAAVVIGGASLSGGHGSVLGACGGALLMAFLRNRCTAMGLPNYVQEIIVGHIIIIAVAVDQLRAARSRS
jgi:ribose transport system permease protein